MATKGDVGLGLLTLLGSGASGYLAGRQQKLQTEQRRQKRLLEQKKFEEQVKKTKRETIANVAKLAVEYADSGLYEGDPSLAFRSIAPNFDIQQPELVSPFRPGETLPQEPLIRVEPDSTVGRVLPQLVGQDLTREEMFEAERTATGRMSQEQLAEHRRITRNQAQQRIDNAQKRARRVAETDVTKMSDEDLRQELTNIAQDEAAMVENVKNEFLDPEMAKRTIEINRHSAFIYQSELDRRNVQVPELLRREGPSPRQRTPQEKFFDDLQGVSRQEMGKPFYGNFASDRKANSDIK